MPTTTTEYTVTATTPYNTTYDTNSFIFDANIFGIKSSAQSNADADYAKLIQEIENTISKNDVLFQQIQKSNYPNPGNYQSDLVNFKIDTKITDLTKTRGQIWDFINKKYIENTGLKKFYYDENRKADEFILQQTNELSELNDLLVSSNMKDTTLGEQIKQEKYQVDNANYYKVLYLALLVCGFICIILLSLKITGIFEGGLIISLLIMVIIAIWVIYYIFFKNISRSNMAWLKNNYSTDTIQNKYSPLTNGINNGSNNSINDEKKKVSIAVDSIVASEKNTGTC